MEQMDGGNPFARMVSVMRSQAGGAGGESVGTAAVRMCLGRVVKTAPLAVDIGGVVIPAEGLRVNADLVRGAKARARITGSGATLNDVGGPISGSISCVGQGCAPQLSAVSGGTLSASVSLPEAEIVRTQPAFSQGDQLLMLTGDEQIFYILCKVVSP